MTSGSDTAMVTGLTGIALVPIIVLVVLLALDGWVYADAKEQLEQGNRVSVSLGSFRVESPQAWFLGCLILWVVFFPLYMTATGRNPFADSSG